MKKAVSIALIFILGAIMGAGGFYVWDNYLQDMVFANPYDYTNEDNPHILDDCAALLVAIKNRDFATIAGFVHPEKGVIFTPFSTVVLGEDQVFSADLVKSFLNDTNLYIWGAMMDGSGEPISLTPNQYFDRFVFDRNYIDAPFIGINTVVKKGNAHENVMDAFPSGSFVEFHFPGSEENSQFDWSSLKLVFEDYNGGRRLVAIIHSEWTV